MARRMNAKAVGLRLDVFRLPTPDSLIVFGTSDSVAEVQYMRENARDRRKVFANGDHEQ